MPWGVLGNSYFALEWVSYTLSFEGVLAQWEAGNFDQIRPGRTGEVKKSELVGMTAVAETGTIAVTIATNYLTVASSSEGSMSFETEE